jgi:hypothetical protein
MPGTSPKANNKRLVAGARGHSRVKKRDLVIRSAVIGAGALMD